MAQVPSAEQEFSSLAAHLFRPYSSVAQQESPPDVDAPAADEPEHFAGPKDERPLLYWSAYYSLPDYCSDADATAAPSASESLLSGLQRILLPGAENVQLVNGVRATEFSTDYSVDEVFSQTSVLYKYLVILNLIDLVLYFLYNDNVLVYDTS